MPEAEKKKALAWVGVIALLLALIVAVSWTPGKNIPAGQQTAGNAPVYAPQGSLTPQFPKELILDDAATIGNSYSLSVSSSTNQYTAQWSSSQSADTMIAKYRTYFRTNGWTVSDSKASSPAFSAISATHSGGYALVAAITETKGSQVSVTYVAR